MTIEKITQEIIRIKNEAEEDWKESKKLAGINSAGANQELGTVDTCNRLLEFIKEN